MRTHILLAGLLISFPAAHAQERTLGVRQSPQTVFDIPVEMIIPRLEGATPTGENGRVGGELVFWGYRLENGEHVYLYACALLEGVDCEQRTRAICPTATTVLEQVEHAGRMIERRCRRIRLVAPGELYPGCVSETSSASLAVGVVSCS